MAGTPRPRLSLVYRLRDRAVERSAADRPPLLILLHGVGSNELAMAALADSFDPRLIVISVRSPIELAPFRFGWWEVEFSDDGPIIDVAQAAAGWARAVAFIDEAAAALGADPARVFVAGFSQGGIVALATMLTAPEKVAGVVCMSGRLPPEVVAQAVPEARLRGRRVLVVHGRQDEVLGVDYGRRADEELRRLGLTVDYRELDLGHTSSAESVETVAAWLTARLDEGLES